MRPIAQPDGHDPPGLVDELVPCLAAVVDEIVVGFEDSVREPVIAHELPDVLHRVELGGFRRQGDDGDVVRHDQAHRHVPAGLIDQEHGVCAGRDGLGDLGEMQVHRLGIAGRQDQGRALALSRADGTEDIGRGGALITRRAWAGAALGPAAGDLVLLANTSLVLEPDFFSNRPFEVKLFQAVHHYSVDVAHGLVLLSEAAPGPSFLIPVVPAQQLEARSEAVSAEATCKASFMLARWPPTQLQQAPSPQLQPSQSA